MINSLNNSIRNIKKRKEDLINDSLRGHEKGTYIGKQWEDMVNCPGWSDSENGFEAVLNKKIADKQNALNNRKSRCDDDFFQDQEDKNIIAALSEVINTVTAIIRQGRESFEVLRKINEKAKKEGK